MAARKVNSTALSAEEAEKLISDIYSKKSYFNKIFQADSVELACSTHIKAFVNEMQRLLIKKEVVNQAIPLETLHRELSDEMKTYNFDDGINKISALFYDTDEKFSDLYLTFIRFIREKFLLEPFWFQATPTIRIQCPNAVNSHHYPRFHSDISYGHPPEEINIWVPLTELLDGHGFKRMDVATSKMIMKDFSFNFPAFIDSSINDKEFTEYCLDFSKDVKTEKGNIIAFDSRCIHSGMPLHTHTRVSMDIRIIPVSRYDQMDIQYQGLGRRKVLFAPGHNYYHLNSDQI